MPCCNIALYKRLQRLFCRPCNLYSQITKTVYRALQGLFLGFVPFYRRKYQTDTSGYNTACATLERLPAPGRLAPIQDTTVTPGRYTGQHSRPIIIRYIRVQRCAPVMDPCQTAQHIADHASPAGSRCFPLLALAWHCAFFLARRRGTIGGLRRISFRAFAQ